LYSIKALRETVGRAEFLSRNLSIARKFVRIVIKRLNDILADREGSKNRISKHFSLEVTMDRYGHLFRFNNHDHAMGRDFRGNPGLPFRSQGAASPPSRI
jgi:hypothetical protein